MNHTPNYNLPQWELDDLIRMEDFNSAMANVENALTGNKADTEAEAAETRAIANSAKVTANAAQAAAAVKPYVVGSYVGTGEDITIELGFRPAFLIISGMNDTEVPNSAPWVYVFGLSAGQSVPNRLVFTDTGFRVLKQGTVINPNYTVRNMVYEYIAFK